MAMQSFQFQYTSGDVKKTLTIYAQETGIEFNFTDFNSGTGYCDWTTISESRPTRYYATTDDNWRSINSSGPLTSAIKGKYGDNLNVMTLEAPSSFFGDSSLHTYNNGKTLTFGSGSGTIKLSWYTWTDYVEGQPVSKAVNGGLYGISPDGNAPYICPNYPRFSYTDTGFPFDSENKPKMAFWIATMVDNVQSSASYNQKFPVLVITMKSTSSSGSSLAEEFAIIDLRLFNGTEPKPSTQNPNRNSTRDGWGGRRNLWSDEDTVTQIPAAMDDSVNFGEHGIFLYELTKADLETVSLSLWSDNLLDKFKDVVLSPSSGILAVHKLPYIATHMDNDKQVIKTCGTEISFSKWKFETFGSSVPLPTVTYNTAKGWRIKRGQLFPSGVLYIEPFFNSFLDYEPYTKISVRLPFIGNVPIPTSSVMGGYIKLNYLCDNCNGNVIAQIYTKSLRNTEDTDSDKWQIIGQYSGNCAMPMSITGNSMGSQGQVGAITGFASSAAGCLIDGMASSKSQSSMMGGIAASGVNSALQYIFAPQEPRIFSSISANTAPMTDLSARIIITRPWDVMPLRWKHGNLTTQSQLLDLQGLESFSGGIVDDYEGFTRGIVNTDGVTNATEAEKNEIKALFAGGVIL